MLSFSSGLIHVHTDLHITNNVVNMKSNGLAGSFGDVILHNLHRSNSGESEEVIQIITALLIFRRIVTSRDR